MSHISNLLSQISGSGGQPSAPIASKRKADDDLRQDVKARRRTPPISAASTSDRPAPRPISDPSRNGNSSRPVGGASRITATDSSGRPYSGSGKATTTASPSLSKLSLANKPIPGRSKESITPTADASQSKAPPKKGSYAEILARAQKAQSVMGQVGKIQHKKVEKAAPPPLNRADSRTSARPDPRGQGGMKPTGYAGSSKPAMRNGAPSNTMRNGNGTSRNPPAKPAKLSAAEKEKAVLDERRRERAKKHAAATTGYTGTSRANPKDEIKKDNGGRGGALLNRAPQRPSGSKHSRYDDYDEELDDFIDYDENQQQEDPKGGGRRYDYYDSDGSSDMEAGLDDIDGEERRAERIARQEDVEEDRLEKSLKAQKEDRKKAALDALRARRG